MHQVDDAVGQAGLLEQLHEVVGGEGGGFGALPDHGVAHEGGRGRQVARDRGEVEGRNREHEAFEWPVLHAVPNAGRRHRLLGVDPRHVLDVEAQEVGQLADGVDLRLVDRLGLAEHGGRVEHVAPRPGEQVGRPQEDPGAVGPGRGRPFPPGLERGADGLPDLGRPRQVHVAQHVAVQVRHHRRRQIAGAQLLAGHHRGDLYPFAGHPLDRAPQGRPLRRARGVGHDRLVVGGRRHRRGGHRARL